MPREKKSPHRFLKWFVLAAVGLFVVTVVSLLWGGSSFSDKDVTLALAASNEQAISGDQITYTVTYKNATKVPLTDMSFRIFYPKDSIVIKDGQPTTPESEAFTVDRLDPGQSGQKEFTIFLVGDKGVIQSAHVHLSYHAGTLKSSFEKDATIATTVTGLPVSLTLVAPPTSVPGQPVQYILDVRNDIGDDLSDLQVIFSYPDGFAVQRTQPRPDQGNTTWHIAHLAAGAGTRITVDGTLSGQEKETKTVKVVLQRTLNGQYVDYVRTDASTMLGSPLLSVSITPNGNRDYTAHPADTLQYVVAYANRFQVTLNDLILTVTLEGDQYDITTIHPEPGLFDPTTRTISYSASSVPNFAALAPGAQGTLAFSISLKPSLGTSGGLFVKATARLSTSTVPSDISGSEIYAADSVVTRISP